MLQTPPIQPPHGCEVSDAASRGTAGSAAAGAFSRALQQATHAERKPAADRPSDTAALRARQHASHRSEPSHRDRATDTSDASRATRAPGDTDAAVTPAHDPPRADAIAATPRESEPDQDSVPTSVLSAVSANDIAVPNPAQPVDRATPSVVFASEVQGASVEVSVEVSTDHSMPALPWARAANANAACARPIAHPADADAGASPIAQPAMLQRQVQTTDPAREATAAMRDARACAAPAETAGASGVATSPALSVAVSAQVPPPSLANPQGSDGRPAVALPEASLARPVHSREFAPAFASQVALWVGAGVHEARLQLHPAELGPISVRIALDGTSAHIDFHAQHAQTRAAIEASLPALGGALNESGLTLAGGGVFGRSSGESGAHLPPPPQWCATGVNRDTRIRALEATAPRHWRRGLLDVFA